MILLALLIGVILVTVAIKGNAGTLFTALGQDVPAFVLWGAAVVALGVIGFIPGLKPISRGLLALLIIVIILRDYQPIIAGFKGALTAGAPTASNTAGTNSTPSGSTVPNSTAAAPVVSSTPTPSNSSAPSPAGSTLSNAPPSVTSSPFGALAPGITVNMGGNLITSFGSEFLNAAGTGF